MTQHELSLYKELEKKYRQQYYAAHKEKMNAYTSAYRKANPDKVKRWRETAKQKALSRKNVSQ